jgi:hypothetical protein
LIFQLLRCCAAGLAIQLAAGAVAHAADAGEDPEALIRIGNDLRRKGDEKRAEGYFKRAYQIAHTPRSAAQLGLVELALGHHRVAEEHLAEALGADDAWVHDHEAVLTSSISKARSHLFAVELVGAPRDATAVAPGGGVRKIPADGVLCFDPGPVKLTVQAVGRKSASVEVSGAAGEKRKVEVSMPEIDAAMPGPTAAQPVAPAEPRPAVVVTTSGGTPSDQPPAPASPPGQSLRVAGVVTGATGVAALIAGAVVFSMGHSKRADYVNPSKPYDPSTASYQTFENAGVALLVGGGALAVGGGVLYLLGVNAEHSGGTVSLNLGPGGGTVGWEGRF